ncbi:hypothetical protein NMG60_11029650 [Bertholletia excelsa]
MEKENPDSHPHRHSGRGRTSTIGTSRSRSGQSSSSSWPASSPSGKHNRNRTRNPINRSSDHVSYSRHSQRPEQEEEDGGKDLLPSSSYMSSLIGTCPFMCPVEERAQRERLRDLSVFERLNGNPGKTSPSLAVKKFCRTISTKYIQASDVRPLPVLEDTLNYLLNLLESKEHSFEVVHDFIFDRTRSIRQDLSMQNIINARVIWMYEKMVKFHAISHHKLRRCGDSPNISSICHLNMEQLMKVLMSLYDLYEANRNSQAIHENEAEFRSLYVLLHLGSDIKPTGESLSVWLRHPSPIMKSKEMCFARRVLRYFRFGNYKQFIYTTATEASCLQYCVTEPYIDEARALALACVNFGGYKLHPYPLEDLAKLLMMKESDIESLCHDCGLKTFTDEKGKKFLPTKQTTFNNPKGGCQNYSLVGSELHLKAAELLR